MRKQWHSPFKFLDAYTAADKDIFFGRDAEIETLYNKLFKTPLMLIYGMSGTGKTSLIQCGLSTRFDGPDWLPFYIRKGGNINDNLREVLAAALPDKKITNLKDIVEELFYTYFRPIYLIFDQFEELFILGKAAEQQQFMQDMQTLIATELPCKILFVMREEYIGLLYDFEKELPGIFDYKLRVEPMSNKRVQEVMEESFKKFHITLGESTEDLYQVMIDNISGGKSGIPLTYLQVYLDMLYMGEYKATFPNGDERTFPPLEFTEEEIEAFGKIDDVLERYLKEKTLEIQQELEKTYSNSKEQTVRAILDIFVTQDGTKRPLGYQQDQKIYHLDSQISEQLQLPNEHLSFCIDKMEQARLLRKGEDMLELGHDSLAELIDQQRTSKQRQLNDIKKRFLSDYKNYDQTGEFLSQKRLNVYEEFLPLLILSNRQTAFVSDSRQYIIDKAAKEKARAEREKTQKDRELKLTKEKLAVEAQARKRQNIYSGLLGLAFLIALSAGWLARSEKLSAERNYQLAEKRKLEAEKNLEIAENAKLKTLAAYEALDSTYHSATQANFDKIFIEAKNHIKKNNFVVAESTLLSGIESVKNYNQLLSEKENREKQDTISYQAASELLSSIELSPLYIRNLEKADSLVKINKYLESIDFYAKALRTGIEANNTVNEILRIRADGLLYYERTAEKHRSNETKTGDDIALEIEGKAGDLKTKIRALRINPKEILGRKNEIN